MTVAKVDETNGAIRLNADPVFEPQGEVFASGVRIHIERLDTGLWWLRIDQFDGPSLVWHFRSKRAIKAHWEWEEQ